MLDDILELMKAMERHHIGEVRWQNEKGKIVLKAWPSEMPHPVPIASSLVDATVDDALDAVDWSEIIESPVVGTYYAAPSPSAPPFVTVGSEVEKGQTICIVEAMKLLNEMVAPHAGVVTEIYAEDGQKVEYGQMLMRLKPLEGEQ